MLQIRLKPVPTPEGGGGAKSSQVETVTVACPDHLVLADLPVAKSLGSATATSLVKTVGRRSRRQLGERVHFCVRCDFPIAIYGRLSPCEHAFCLDCARSDSICYLCDERIQKIQTIKLMEGIFICAAPHCLKSFLKRSEFESHVHQTHADILGLNRKKDGTEPEAVSSKQPTSSDSTIQAPPRPVLSPSSNSQINDREDKAHRMQPHLRPVIQPKSTPSGFGQLQDHLSEPPSDNNQPPQGFDRPSPQNRFSQQSFDTEVVDKQQGNVSETPYPEYPMHPHQPPNFAVPVNSNYVVAPPPFGYPPFANDGAQPFYGAPFEMTGQDSAPEVGPEQGSLLGFPPGGVNFSESLPRPWNLGPESSPQFQDFADGFRNMSDSRGRIAFFQGGILPSNLPLPPPADKGMEPVRGGNAMDTGDYKGILVPQPLQLPPPPPHSGHHKRGKFYPGDMGRDGHGFGWQHEKRDSFESGQD